MMVVQKKDKGWLVVSNHGCVFGTFKTNAEAWKHFDRLRGEPTSRSEQVAEYIWRKMCHEGVNL